MLLKIQISRILVLPTAGSMLFTKVNGRGDSSDSKMTKFVTFGGRSFSIRALPDLDLLYDSGNDIEHRMAAEASDVFNCPVQDGPNVVRYDRDKTSIHVVRTTDHLDTCT